MNKTREELVQMYIEALQADQLPWKCGWLELSPENPCSKIHYRGVNRMKLGLIAQLKEFKDPRWATFKQIQDNGWKLKKGSKGAKIELWKLMDIKTNKWIDLQKANELEKDGRDPHDFRWVTSTAVVFNLSCCTGVPDFNVNKGKFVEDEFVANFVENMKENMGIDIGHGYQKAFYYPGGDKVCMPDKAVFESTYDYYATLLHEMSHATGHEQRLNRGLFDVFGSENYAKEELVAEISSSFCMSDLGFSGNIETYDNHSAYIQSWIRVIQNDPNTLFKAINEAEKAANFLMDKGKENLLEQSKNQEINDERDLENEMPSRGLSR